MFKDLLVSYSKISVCGMNYSLFIKKLKREKIELYNLEIEEKSLIFCVKKREIKKVFAISEEMCYNIRIIKSYGVTETLKKALKTCGLTAGAICFSVMFILSSFSVRKIEVKGVPYNYSRMITDKLKEIGIRENGLATKSKIKNAEKTLLRSFSAFSYVSVKKEGFYLRVEAKLAYKENELVDKNRTFLVAPKDGKITRLVVYSGFSEKRTGDVVKAGDVIVTGAGFVGEKEYFTYVLADVQIETAYNYEYISQNENEEDVAIAFAELSLGDRIISEEEVSVEKTGDKYVYTVTITYLLNL